MADNKVLVIIDMQPFFLNRAKRNWRRFWDSKQSFLDEWNKVTKGIQQEIRIAKKNKELIIVVEYWRMETNKKTWTVSALRKTIGKYPHVVYLNKDFDDGSSTIQNELKRRKIQDVAVFKITGVNRSFCVADTAKNLSRKYSDSKILLIDEAIGDEHGDNGWGNVTAFSNTAIVPNSTLALV